MACQPTSYLVFGQLLVPHGIPTITPTSLFVRGLERHMQPRHRSLKQTAWLIKSLIWPLAIEFLSVVLSSCVVLARLLGLFPPRLQFASYTSCCKLKLEQQSNP